MDLRQQLQQTLGDAYVLERELGGGGMSRVFVADERRLNRKVVIKLLSPELAAGVNAERFEREIQLAASLQQANIVPILAAGDTQGVPYYTMPLVEGESLRARLVRTGPLSIGEVASVLRDVVKALSYAHERGVVHRDIKPDNVLLSGGTAVVTDFGIAKAISAARKGSDGATLTQLGTSLGTPAYMSPEQAAGDPDVDHRSDVYSLGCMAYELLAGQSPFHGRTPARMLGAHLSETPQSVAALRPDTPAALEQLVMRCLAKDPAQRPQSGAEILQALDNVASGAHATGEITADPPRSLARTIAEYAAAALAVAIVARAAVIALGAPEWAFSGALLLGVLGVPAVVYAWHTKRPWRRVWTGGATVLGSFAAIVVGSMILRVLGIGPEGSLLAAGELEDRGRVIVTAFPAPDSSLGTLVTEAVRTNLGQSQVVSIVPPVAIAAALQRMQRPVSSPLTLELAREIAQREGIKAILDGAVRPLGQGYVLSLRLVSTDSVKELAAFQETADSPREILQVIDKLTRKLRGKIGESLREVRGSPALEQVTTPSLEALRIYAEASRSIDMGGSPVEAAERLREAIKLDTTFAMAYRKLGVALNNSGMPRIRVDSALAGAYRFRDRLTERERLLAEGTYFHLGPGRDRRRAIRAYEALLAIDSNEVGAANNLATLLSGRREFVRAESLFKRMIENGRATSQQYTNLVGLLFNSGKIDEAERLAAETRVRYPGTMFSYTSPLNFLYHRGQLDSVDLLLKELVQRQDIVARINGHYGLVNLAFLRGQPQEAMQHSARARRLQESLGQPADAMSDSVQRSWIDLIFYEDTTRALQRVEALLARTDFRAMPFEQRPYLALAQFFASARDAQRARALLAQHDAAVPDSVTRRDRENGRQAVLGYIALAEGRYEEAARRFWSADSTYDGPSSNCTVCVMDDLGLAWSYAPQPDSAIYYWERFLATPQYGRQGLDASMRPFILKRLGELYESKGDIANAALRYREFIKLWERAEPGLRGKVEDVRFRLARLSDSEGKGRGRAVR